MSLNPFLLQQKHKSQVGFGGLEKDKSKLKGNISLPIGEEREENSSFVIKPALTCNYSLEEPSLLQR